SDVPAGHHQDAVARRRPDPGHALQVGRLPTFRDRAGHYHYAVFRRADQRTAAHTADRSRAADRCRPVALAALQSSDATGPDHRWSATICRPLGGLQSRLGTPMKALILPLLAAATLAACSDPAAEQAAR